MFDYWLLLIIDYYYWLLFDYWLLIIIDPWLLIDYCLLVVVYWLLIIYYWLLLVNHYWFSLLIIWLLIYWWWFTSLLLIYWLLTIYYWLLLSIDRFLRFCHLLVAHEIIIVEYFQPTFHLLRCALFMFFFCRFKPTSDHLWLHNYDEWIIPQIHVYLTTLVKLYTSTTQAIKLLILWTNLLIWLVHLPQWHGISKHRTAWA